MVEKKQKLKSVLAKAYLAVVLFFNYFMADVTQVYAADIGEQIGGWATKQLFWIAAVALAIVLIMCLVKKAWVGMLVTGIAGGIALVFIGKPQLLANIGQSIFDAIFSS